MGLESLWRRAERYLYGDDYERADGACRSAPEWLVLVINNFCNLRCKMCDVGLGESASVFYAHLVGEEPRNMSVGMLERLLAQASAWHPKPRIGLAYTEPLLHVHILELCRRIVQAGFFCSITTNGWMLPRLAKGLVEAGVDEIVVSVDGPEVVHDQVRGRSGSFRNLYEGVEQLTRTKQQSKKRKPAIRFSYTLTDSNYECLLDFVRQVEPLEPTSLNVSHLNFISTEMADIHNAVVAPELAVSRSNVGKMALDHIDYQRMWEALVEVREYAASRPRFPHLTIVPEFASPHELALYYQQPLRFVRGTRCTDPWRMLMIKTDGTVIPAHGRCYNVPIGNVQEAPLADLWNHARLRNFRRTLHAAGGALPACARCCGVIGK